MPSTLSILKLFATGQGAGIGTYTAFAADHDSNYTDIEDWALEVKTELDALGGSAAGLQFELIQANDPALSPNEILDGRVGDHAYRGSIITAGTQVQITAGKFLIGGDVVTLTSDKVFTGSGGSGTRYFALQADGDVTQETLSGQGVQDIYEGTWNSSIFTALTRNANTLVDGDDFQECLATTGSASAGPPNESHVKIADRLENAERMFRGEQTNVTGGANLGPLAFRGTTPGAPGLIPGDGTTFDPNTGLYAPGADRLGISTGGTLRAEFDAEGNLDLPTQSRVRVSTASATSVADGATGTLITFDTEDEDVAGWFTASSTTVTVPTGANGGYSIVAHVQFDESSSAGTPHAGDYRVVEITAGGITRRMAVPPTTATIDTELAVPFANLPLVATNTISVRAIQNSGGTMDVFAELEVQKVR